MEQRTSAINTLDTVVIGHIAISMTNWTLTTEPAITAGSALEIGGSMFYATANESIDSTAAWGGIAWDTLVFIMYGVVGTTATAELTTTAPVWDAAKQGWYNAAMTKRYVGSIYKTGGGYTQKTIFLNREIGITYQGLNLGGNSANANRIIQLATDATITWNEAADRITINKNLQMTGTAKKILYPDIVSTEFSIDALTVLLATKTNGEMAVTLKKPISAYFIYTNATLHLAQNGAYRLITGGVGGTTYLLQLNPGLYRIIATGAGNSGSLYCSGVFGISAITVAEIVDAV